MDDKINGQLIQLFEETIKKNSFYKEPVSDESLAFFLAANTKPDKSSTEISIQVPEDGLIPNIATRRVRDASTLQKQADDNLREMFANKPVEPPTYKKNYNAKIIINGQMNGKQ